MVSFSKNGGNFSGKLDTEFLQENFQNQEVPRELNQTVTVLIPKRTGAETVHHYRPISLCNTMYKVFMKVVVNRLWAHVK